MARKAVLILDDVSKPSLESKVNREIGEPPRYGMAYVLLTQVHQLLVLSPLLFTFIYRFLKYSPVRKFHFPSQYKLFVSAEHKSINSPLHATDCLQVEKPNANNQLLHV